ncbi:hypothetical protein F5Y19DRAFT_465924 [Xylariaceae sp. FL1651]|nr:hypothetical protein F5Y19DRAFT_465924 [Xylariaceae sp. FL1651]
MSDANAYHLRTYQDWTIGSDSSVNLTPDLANQPGIGEYFWESVEIASPALWATGASWDEIRAVVQAITDEYWVLTPSTAGVHYHYGNGSDYIPFAKLRRIAAFLMAADPLLVQLHPEHRRDNYNCLSNRLYSRVAHGIPAETVAQELEAAEVEEAPEDPRMQTARPTPSSRAAYQRTPALKVAFKRGQLTGYNFNQALFLTQVDADEVQRENPQPLEIPYAVRELLRCVNAPTVAELMSTRRGTGDRPAYSFSQYRFPSYKKPMMLGSRIDRRRQPKRTVEFRQMAATTDPDVVVAHGKVIVRLCEWAVEADLEHLWKVVLDCAVAEDNGDWYDVFDLLAELDLVAEARVLQRDVAQFRGETIPGEDEAASKAETQPRARGGTKSHDPAFQA